MYCQSCGAQLAPELSYCNRCGVRLTAGLESVPPPPARLTGVTWGLSLATVVVTLGGFAMVLAFIMALVDRGIPFSDGIIFLLFCFLFIILIVAGLLGRQLSHVLQAYLQSGATTAAAAPKTLPKSTWKQQPPPPPPAPQLEGRGEPVSSVTEHTTQIFEPVYRERDES